MERFALCQLSVLWVNEAAPPSSPYAVPFTREATRWGGFSAIKVRDFFMASMCLFCTSHDRSDLL